MPVEVLSVPMSPELHWQQHQNFWFPDGDVVLSAQLTEVDRQLYRVHRHIISAVSKMLHDALSDSESSITHPNTPLYEGAPLVHVMDSATDLTTVLTYAYPSEYVAVCHATPKLIVLSREIQARVPRYDNTTCNLYSALMKVALNYDMGGLLEELETQLDFVWPSTLDKWDQRVAHYQAIARSHIPLETANEDGRVDGQYLDDRLPEPVFAIHLFRRYKLYKYLPAAFYELSLITPTVDWVDLHHEPHRRSGRSRRLLSNRIRSARWSHVTQEDHMCLHKYFRKIQTLSLIIMPPESDLCTGPACLHGRMYIQLEILHEINRLRDILEVLNCRCQQGEQRKMMQEGVCGQCVPKIVDFLRAKRRYVFENLARFFSLPSPRDDEA